MTRLGTLLASPVIAALLALCLAPLAVMFLYSFYQVDFVAISRDLTLANYTKIAGSPTYRGLIARAFGSAALVVVITAVIAYPVAWLLAKRVGAAKSTLLTLLLVPLYSGDLVRIFAWRVLLGAEGVINRSLLWLGAIDVPLQGLLFSPLAIHIALIYNYLPFMVIGLWLAFEALDDAWLEAASDLGAPVYDTFRRVVLPLTLPGLIAGGLMVFVMVTGDYLTPQLLGGASGITVVSAINDLFGTAFDWPLGSAIASTMLAILVMAFAAGALAIRGSSLVQGRT